MTGDHFSLILLPTLRCNAACDYCFENKRDGHLPLAHLAILAEKVFDHMTENGISELTIHWQGGEVMTSDPGWFEAADRIIRQAAERSGKQVQHCIQSNMIGYGPEWESVLANMFGNRVGSSLDYPNLHRKLAGGTPHDYDVRWWQNVQAARNAGIHVGVIAIPNRATFEIGAQQFYSHFADELGITDFQINTPFAGGALNDTKEGFPLNTDDLTRFLIELADIWIEREDTDRVRMGPFDALTDYFTDGVQRLPCIWQDNCANGFVCVDPSGNVSQCDCWVASYPAYRFGNIFDSKSLTALLADSQTRQRFLARPGQIVQKEDCLECDYLALCHGGCPIRAYTAQNNLFDKDPYCDTYKALFSHMKDVSSRIARHRQG